jgi:3-hydroxyacyl-CoA dehydrogenase/enoyl-CoA hydratase/3-hydroxybutyryl-CoA epimerase
MNTSTFKNWSLETDERNITWLKLATEDKGPNILGHTVLKELDNLLDQLRSDRPAGLIITSAKANGFIAGADIREFTQINNEDEALALIRNGQRVFDKLEALPFPTLALINGYCLGGGTELALACDYRIALDDPETRIALPEVKLGIHPGFGGTMRSIRVMGPIAAMNMMLTGSGLDTRRAKQTGLVDDRVPQRQMESAARHTILTKPKRRRMNWQGKLINLPGVRSLVAQQMRKTVRNKAPQDHYPAPYALISLWEQYAGNEQTMLTEEARSVSRLILTDTALNLIRVFNLQTALKSLGNKKSFSPTHVHVIGAGAMGGDIAAWCALRGMRVSVQDMNRAALARTMQRADKLFRRRFRSYPQLATAAMDRLIPDESGVGIPQADVVIEAIVEKLDIKQAVFRDLEKKAKPDALLATNTSSLPVEKIAEGLDDPGRLIGLHFFNPVAKMPLLEIVVGPQTHETTKEHAMAFARHIDKLPAAVKSSPGFLVNRILMPYLLECVLMEH